jgi:group I intron endonuclease
MYIFIVMIGIYKITSPNNKVYIGQSNDIDKRKKGYMKYPNNCKSQVKLYNSIMKYGWLNHVFEIVEECTFEELNVRERYWQEYYNSVNKGLNCLYTKTDEQKAIFSEESKQRMSNAQTGKKVSDSTKEKMKLARIGMKLSSETKKKISIAHLGKTFSDETLEKMKESAKKDKSKNKPLSCLSPDKKLHIFSSIKDAALEIGVSHQAVCNVLYKYKSKDGICKGWSNFKLIEIIKEKK